jgi:hypothetical protein
VTDTADFLLLEVTVTDCAGLAHVLYDVRAKS